MEYQINGNLRSRFTQVATLLCMLDPVRGEPTAYGLDQDSNDVESSKSQLLKSKFLDSFALICCTEKGRDRITAACIEEGKPEGTTVRIASNAGVSEQILSQLREIVKVLNEIGSRTCDATAGELDVLDRIVKLDVIKIRQYLEDIRKSPDAFQGSLSEIETSLIENSLQPSEEKVREFLAWVTYGRTINGLARDAAPEVLNAYVIWAKKAKKHYFEFLKAAFAREKEFIPRWICTIFKLGRYGVAARALVKLAFELPQLVNPMDVESIKAPPAVRIPQLEEEKVLSSVLKRVIGNDKTPEVIQTLAQIWHKADPETFFRRACSVDLVAHAEMQIVNFYDHNPDLRPGFRFIGVSKKTCYLCDLSIKSHPLSFRVSSCHQKLYPAWIPPPARLLPYRQCKNMILGLVKVMEYTAKRDIEDRLGIRRSPVPADSTAGVSLSGLTDLVPQILGFQTSYETYLDEENNDSVAGVEFDSVSGQPENDNASSTETDTTTSADDTSQRTVHAYQPDSKNPNLETMSDLSISRPEKPKPETVFHITHSNDPNRQEIIQLSDVVDASTNHASWKKLVQIMRDDGQFGLSFKQDRDYLTVNNQIRVANERQFLACLQYLLNLSILNINAVVNSPPQGHEDHTPQPNDWVRI